MILKRALLLILILLALAILPFLAASLWLAFQNL
jgi:hypothetical protein